MRVSTRASAPIGANGDAKDRVIERGTDRQDLVPHIRAWMRQHCADQGVDVLLTRPLDAIRMALAVATKAGRVSAGDAAELFTTLRSLRNDNSATFDAVDAICRAAMCARKRGELNSTKGGQTSDEATDRGSSKRRPPAPGTPGRAGGVAHSPLDGGKPGMAKAPPSRKRKAKGAQ